MTEEEKRKLKVFLCYASEDKLKVEKYYHRLVADGFDAWMDEKSLLPGVNWEQEIRQAVERAAAIIVFISRESVRKEGYVQKEIKLALDIALEKPDGTIYLIPARLENVEPPYKFKSIQWVDLFRKDGYAKVRQALGIRAKQLELNVIPAKENLLWKKVFTIGGIILAFAVLFVLAFFGKPWASALFPQSFATATVTTTLSDTPTQTPFPVSPPTLLPTLTFTPVPTSTPTVTPTPTPLPERFVDAKGIVMALISEGEFTMGNNSGLSPEKPEHRIFLPNYYIDVFEVTNASYAACVTAGACQHPVSGRSRTVSNYYASSELANFPVVYVTWEMAQTYCGWRTGRLPTEAEWEKAARGTDQRLFPNGAGMSCTLANYCREDTTEVGRYQESPSPYGLFDMAGNVAEWIADWYSAGYYGASLPENPTGPATGQLRVVRGGSFASTENHDLQTTARAAQKPDSALDYLGFRCVSEP